MANSDTAGTVATSEESPFTVQGAGWWLDQDADEVEGYDLIRDDALFALVGVPFGAFRVIYREGIQRKGAKWRDDYVSVETRVAPAQIMAAVAGRIATRRAAAARSLKLSELPVPAAFPDEQLVINDGSTGLYRQITGYLHAKELIKLPEGDVEGGKGDSIYDLPRSQWLAGAEEASKGIDINMRCSRGLRFSDYENDYTTPGEQARTWYIA